MGGEGAFTETAFEEAFIKLDINGDGKIAFDELCHWFF